ncbi:MAG: hypothetical protein H6910_06710, partial [Rickettsiaceae bacterium]|nr:hypothetical protein [Rickettsiaceae bacterium]
MTFQKQLNLANKQFIEAGKNLEKKEYEKASTLYQNALGEYNSIVEKTEFVQYVRPKDSVIRDDILKNIQHGYCNLAVAYFNQNKLQEAHSTYHEAIDKKYLKISDIVAENCSIESQMMIIQNKLANDKYNKLINSEITQDSILQLDNLLKKD